MRDFLTLLGALLVLVAFALVFVGFSFVACRGWVLLFDGYHAADYQKATFGLLSCCIGTYVSYVILSGTIQGFTDGKKKRR